MPKELKIPYALKGGLLVHVGEVMQGAACGCVCAGCNKPLVARKGIQKTHHFAHESKKDGESCSPESVLHKLGKLFLRERIEAAIQSRKPITFSWKCDRCSGSHTGNLAKKAARVALEVSLVAARADLLVYNAADEPYLAVEIVHTHRPEPEALAEYRRRKIECVEFRVDDLDDLERLRTGDLESPSRLAFCDAKVCPKCRQIVDPRHLYFSEEHCPFCDRDYKTVFGGYSEYFELPSFLDAAEVKHCISQGVVFGNVPSGGNGKKRLCVICPSCKIAHASQAYGEALHTGRTSITPIQVLYWCSFCRSTHTVAACSQRRRKV